MLRLAPRTTDVRITFAAVSVSNPEAIRFRYKPADTGKAWHEVDTAGPVAYRNLSPGVYHFSVQASDTSGARCGNPTTVRFRILPAFYQTRWFLALCIAAGAAMLYVAYLVRVRQLARRYEIRSRERIAERNRIAREFHDSLLQGVQGLMFRLQGVRHLLPQQPVAAADALEQALHRGDSTIAEVRDAVQDLRASARGAGDLADALEAWVEELGANGGEDLAYRFYGTGRRRLLAPVVRDELYQVEREAFRNALRHSRGRRIEIELEYSEKNLIVRVRDSLIRVFSALRTDRFTPVV